MRTAKSKTTYEKHGNYGSCEKHGSYGIYENYNSHASHNSRQRMSAALAAEGAEMPAGIRGVV